MEVLSLFLATASGVLFVHHKDRHKNCQSLFTTTTGFVTSVIAFVFATYAWRQGTQTWLAPILVVATLAFLAGLAFAWYLEMRRTDRARGRR